MTQGRGDILEGLVMCAPVTSEELGSRCQFGFWSKQHWADRSIGADSEGEGN